MKHYDRNQELAPRDIVSRAIWAEMQRTKARHVYLDVTHLGSTFLKETLSHNLFHLFTI